MHRRRLVTVAATGTIALAVGVLTNVPLPLAQAAPPATDELVLSPTQGPPGSDIAVSGGCAEPPAVVSVAVGSAAAVDVQSDTDHRFSTTLRAPDTPGAQEVTLVCTSLDFTATAVTASFTVVGSPVTTTTAGGGTTTSTTAGAATSTSTTSTTVAGATSTTVGGSTTTSQPVSSSATGSGSGSSATSGAVSPARAVTANASYVG